MKEVRTTIRFNEEDKVIHEWLKDFFGFRKIYGEDSQTLKQAEIVAFNVLRNTFGDQLKDIFKRNSLDQLQEIREIQQIRIKKSRTKTQKTYDKAE